MQSYLIKNATIVNEGKQSQEDVLVKNGRIETIATGINVNFECEEIDANGKFLLPGVIDDQVHFREPGLTYKATIYSEAKAAVAGGVTSFMEMPNTKPPALTQKLLEDKYNIASKSSLANYSFYMGGGNDNFEEVMETDLSKVCGLKLFMGSSTGNMLVDDEKALNYYFKNFKGLIATHCEDEELIKSNEKKAKEKYDIDVPFYMHPVIRSVEACYLSSSKAVDLAKKYNTRLHILHLTTAKELSLFSNNIPLEKKKITNEVCVHHLWFDSEDYYIMGSRIKCNPAIKHKKNKEALFKALLDNNIDVIATDHAPHTLEEKQNTYFKAPSGLPLVQHSLAIMLDYYVDQKITIEKIVEKMCHAPAICFKVKERGFIREGYYADLVLVDLNQKQEVNKNNILYKCKWSPLEGWVFRSKIDSTFVNGNKVYSKGQFNENTFGSRIIFDR